MAKVTEEEAKWNCGPPVMVAFVPDGLREVPGMEDRLEFPLTMMKNDEWNIT